MRCQGSPLGRDSSLLLLCCFLQLCGTCFVLGLNSSASVLSSFWQSSIIDKNLASENLRKQEWSKFPGERTAELLQLEKIGMEVRHWKEQGTFSWQLGERVGKSQHSGGKQGSCKIREGWDEWVIKNMSSATLCVHYWHIAYLRQSHAGIALCH